MKIAERNRDQVWPYVILKNPVDFGSAMELSPSWRTKLQADGELYCLLRDRQYRTLYFLEV